MLARVALLLACLFLVAPVQAEESLYKRLGGYDAIFAVTDDFLGRLINHPQTSKYFVGASTNTRQRIRQHVVDFIAANTGGPTDYQGRGMRVAHKGLGITKAEWRVSTGLLIDTLQKFKVPKKESDELLTLVHSVEDEIVEKK